MTNSNKRIHAFDFIRSLAALWGVVFHAGIAYMATDPSPWMILDPQAGSPLIDLMIWLSHRLRMPLFFLMSGFFAHLVMQRKGVRYFLNNRIKKILIPLLVGGAIILPLIVEFFGKEIIPNINIFNTNFGNPYSLSNIAQIKLAHLWFLYYLFLFSLITIALNKINLFNKVIDLAQKNMRGFSFITFCILFLMHFSMDNLLKINPTIELGIDWLAFSYYYVFFLFGITLRSPHLLETLKTIKAKPLLITTLCSGIITAGIIFIYQADTHAQFTTLLAILINMGTTIYCLSSLLAILNIGLRFIQKENAFISYLSDSSYWVYIVHLPVVILFQRSLYFLEIPVLSKWIIVTILSYAVLFLSYQLLVRYTAIGEYLHGKRQRVIKRKAVII